MAAACLLWYVAAGFEVATFGCWSGNAAVAGERERGEASRGGAGTRDRASPDASSRHSSEFVGRVCLQRHRRARGRRGGGGSAPRARTVPRATAARCREAALGGANSSVHRPRPRQRRENIVVRKSSKGRWSAVRQRSGREEEEEEYRQRIVELVSQHSLVSSALLTWQGNAQRTSTLARTRRQKSRRSTLSSVGAMICGSWSRVRFFFC